ncbi:hypothetical protein PBRA_001049 [Plasmodiophora brassicae]|nr:hypothetical protein PBRA_001049 [Plasmodiophora brassicae]
MSRQASPSASSVIAGRFVVSNLPESDVPTSAPSSSERCPASPVASTVKRRIAGRFVVDDLPLCDEDSREGRCSSASSSLSNTLRSLADRIQALEQDNERLQRENTSLRADLALYKANLSALIVDQ